MKCCKETGYKGNWICEGCPMNQLEKDSNNIYCVPAALSILTDKPVGDCVSLIRNHLGDQAIEGIYLPIAWLILKRLGYQPSRAESLDDVTLSNTTRLKGNYLVSIGGHALAIKDGIIFDNRYPNGISPKDYPHKKAKIKLAYRITT